MGPDLCSADLGRKDLGMANLSAGDSDRSKPTSANLIAADLTGADLSGADLSSANFAFADLVAADLDGRKRTLLECTSSQEWAATGANLTNATVGFTQFSEIELQAQLRDSIPSGKQISTCLIGIDTVFDLEANCQRSFSATPVCPTALLHT